MSFLAHVFIIFVGLIALAAAYWDVVSFTLPNRMTAGLAGLFFVFSGIYYFEGSIQLPEIGLACAAAAAVFVVGVGLFLIGAIGGGDVKYLAAATLWAMPVGLREFALATSISGALVGVIYLAMPKVMFLIGGKRASAGAGSSGFVRPMPYGAAISVGLVCVVWLWFERISA